MMRNVWIILPAIFLLCSIGFNVIAFASTGKIGSDLYVMGQQTSELAKENADLTKQLAALRSIQALVDKATQDGYVGVTGLVQVVSTRTQVAMDLPATTRHE